MPTSLDSLRRHRAAHSDAHESVRVWFFHAHAYFDHEDSAQVATAHAFIDLIRATFTATPHVEVHSFVPRPAGPHPRGSFEILFTRDVVADVLAWLMFERPDDLSILVHPLTRSQTLDHTSRAVWLGTPLAIDVALFDAMDAKALAAGRAEESIIDHTKRH